MKIKYIIFLLIIVGLVNFSNIKLNSEEIPDFEINEELVYQEVDKIIDENNLLELNEADVHDFINIGLSENKAKKIIEYRNFIGHITKIEDLYRIEKFGKQNIEILKDKSYIDEDKEVVYVKHNINNLNRNQLKLLGFNKNEIKKILEYLKNNEISSSLDIKELIKKDKYDIIKDSLKYVD